MTKYKYINTGKIIKLGELITSGDIGDKNMVEVFNKDGKFICRGNWFQDQILDFINETGAATKAGTGLTVKFRFAN
jgi:hypothetical protein